MAKASDPKDPRFRAYRLAAYTLYMVLVGAMSLLVILSVVRSARLMSPRQPREVEVVLSPRECVERSETMWRQLEGQRQALSGHRPARQADQAWTSFRVEWMRRLKELEAMCAPGTRDRQGLARMFRQLERVADLYTIGAIQYAGQVGAAVDGLRESLNSLKADPSHGRLP